ncbi:MAG: IS66 family transposase zinc-finger binding domain-containing protein [Chloroflexi bacterium]|nr:IS66 family transposase zinc-finger binding domain-containing protein [Chloroflexota bacterium]
MTSELGPPQPQTLAEALVLIQALWAENARLRDAVARLAQQVQTLAAQVGQDSTNSSRPPSADPPRRPPPPPRRPTGRRRGAQPGHLAHQRAVLPPEQVDHTVDHYPPICQHCRAPLAPDLAQTVGEPVRHQVVEVPPMRAEVTDHYLSRRRCPHCRGETRAGLPPEAPTGPFGPRLQAIVAVLSGRSRLSEPGG